MTSSIDDRLRRLNIRRKGLDRSFQIGDAERADILAKSLTFETYQKRAEGQPNTRYAIGAMQEVGAEYTRVSVDEAIRVGKQLQSGLTAAGISLGLDLQGSVPLNIHIRGVSDVDLLALDTGFFTYDRTGIDAVSGRYNSPTGYTAVSALQRLRREAERTLIAAYPKAEVDCKGSKAIKLSGGSLRRPVDVVPSHWHNTADYQRSGEKHDRGVAILDRDRAQTIANLPFLHIKRVDDRDRDCWTGLKKAIRLCKNIKADAQEDGKTIALPSFDIAAMLYHADQAALRAGVGFELAILAETQRHVDHLARNFAYAQTLRVPDGSRRIFDTAEKLRALVALSSEIDELAFEVAREQAKKSRIDLQDAGRVKEALRGAFIPI